MIKKIIKMFFARYFILDSFLQFIFYNTVTIFQGYDLNQDAVKGMYKTFAAVYIKMLKYEEKNGVKEKYINDIHLRVLSYGSS